MVIELTGKSGTKYGFETSGFSASREPKFATPGVYVFAQQSSEEIKPMFVDHAMNIHQKMNDQKQMGSAVDRYKCNIILWQQAPARLLQRIVRDLVDEYHPPMNGEPPGL